MLVLVIVLLVLNAVTATALVRVTRRRASAGPDGTVEVFEAPRPPGVRERDRRLITVEVLNPLQLASARGGRIAGLAGSLVPGITRRVVYDQVFKTLRRELERMAVHADVRLHTLHRAPRRGDAQPDRTSVVDTVPVDDVAPLDLDADERSG